MKKLIILSMGLFLFSCENYTSNPLSSDNNVIDQIAQVSDDNSEKISLSKVHVDHGVYVYNRDFRFYNSCTSEFINGTMTYHVINQIVLGNNRTNVKKITVKHGTAIGDDSGTEYILNDVTQFMATGGQGTLTYGGVNHISYISKNGMSNFTFILNF